MRPRLRPPDGGERAQTVSGEKGPHPDLDSDFELVCDVVIPALS